MNNNIYNLINQLTQENKSLWRIKKSYSKDAGTNKELKAFWTKMAKDKEEHIKELQNLIAKHMK